MGRVRLFVYGSLKRGGRHHDELAGAVFLGPATTMPGYRLEPLGEYLALVSLPPPPQAETHPQAQAQTQGQAPQPATPQAQAAQPQAKAQAQAQPEHETDTGTATAVPGELFEVDESKLRALDEFEGDAYERGNVRLEGDACRNLGFALAYFRKAR